MSEPALADHRATITQRLAARLGELILAGTFAPGSALREGELAARYEVSRHVIREVLRTLAADGLVDYASFRGARVPVLTVQDARDIYRARAMAECGPHAMSAAVDRKAVARIHSDFSAAVKARDWRRAFDLDVAFHAVIVAGAGSPRAATWLAGLLRDLRLAHLTAPEFNARAFEASVVQHAEIVDALTAGDAEAARAAMRRHLDDAEQLLIEGMGGEGASLLQG